MYERLVPRPITWKPAKFVVVDKLKAPFCASNGYSSRTSIWPVTQPQAPGCQLEAYLALLRDSCICQPQVACTTAQEEPAPGSLERQTRRYGRDLCRPRACHGKHKQCIHRSTGPFTRAGEPAAFAFSRGPGMAPSSPKINDSCSKVACVWGPEGRRPFPRAGWLQRRPQHARVVCLFGGDGSSR